MSEGGERFARVRMAGVEEHTKVWQVSQEKTWNQRCGEHCKEHCEWRRGTHLAETF